MVSLTSEQTATISHLLACAAATYNLPDSHQAPSQRSSTVALSSLQDGDDGRLISNSPFSRAIVLSLTYLSEESISSGDADRAVIIVLPDGTPLGAPYDLTGEVTVTAPFDCNELLDDTLPRPQGYELEKVLLPEIKRGLTMVMASVYTKARRQRADGQ